MILLLLLSSSLPLLIFHICCCCVQASRWCQTSRRFLDELNERAEDINQSDQAEELVSELIQYRMSIEDQQDAQIEQVGKVVWR